MKPKLKIFGLLLMDIILIHAAEVLTFLARYLGQPQERNIKAYLEMALILTVIRLASFYVFGLYRLDRRRTHVDVFYLTALAVTVGSVVIVAWTFYARAFAYPRTVLAISWLFNIILVGGFRSILLALSHDPAHPRRVVVVGGGNEAQAIVEDIQLYTPNEYEVVGMLEWVTTSGAGEEISRSMDDLDADIMILTHPELPEHETLRLLESCLARGVEVAIHPNLYEVLIGRVEIKEVAGIPLIEIRTQPLEGWQRLLKRTFDLCVSFLAVVLLAPFWLLAPILIRRGSSGPAYFLQERVGKNGKRFKIIKCRTMYTGAEDDSGPVFAKPDDTRITTTGRWLRRYRLDELPQLFNVLRGDMSLVGPRPERPVFVKRFTEKIPSYTKRLVVKPGITGLAQIHGRYDTTTENKLRYDLSYINGWSLLLDLKILALTLRVVIKGKGAQ